VLPSFSRCIYIQAGLIVTGIPAFAFYSRGFFFSEEEYLQPPDNATDKGWFSRKFDVGS
jgi:hypothetical protein